MSKKILSVLLALVMVLSMAPVTVFASDTQFVISSTDAVVGEYVTVTVGMTGMSDLMSSDLEFYYNSEYLKFVSIEANDDSGLSSWDYAGGNPEEGLATFSFMYLENSGRDRDIADITFEVLQDGSSDIYATARSIQGCSYPYDAWYTISTGIGDDIFDDENPDDENVLLGDYDGDGYTTSADARLLLRVAAGLEIFDGSFLAADMTDDDRITAADARLAMRYSAFLEIDENVAPARRYLDVERSEDVALSATTVYDEFAQTVTVAVSADNVEDLENANLFFEYNSQVLEFVSIECADYNNEIGIAVGDKYEDGKISFAFCWSDWCRINNVDIALITFNVLSQETSFLACEIGTWDGTDVPENAVWDITLENDNETPDDETPDVDENTGDYLESGGFSFIVEPSADNSTVDITIGVLDEFSWGSFEIYFNSQYLEYVGYDDHDELAIIRGSFEAGIPNGYGAEDGMISASCMFTESSGGALKLATFTFNVLQEGSTALTVIPNPNDWGFGDAPAQGNIVFTIGNDDDYNNDDNYGNDVCFVFSSTDAVVGEYVTVTVGMTGMSDLMSSDLEFYYNSEYLKFVSIESNDDSGLGSWDYAGGNPEEGFVTFSFMYLENAGRDRDLADITFEVLKDGSSDVYVTAHSCSGCSYPADVWYTISTVTGDDIVDDDIFDDDIIGDDIVDDEENNGTSSVSGGFSFIVEPSEDNSTVDVTIGVTDEFAWGVFEIYFDATCLEYVGYNKHDELKSKRGSFDAGIPNGYIAEDGVISAACMFSESSGGALKLATLTFNVLNQESSTLTVSATDDWGFGYPPADGSVNIDVHKHDYTAVVTEPSCCFEGFTTYTCSICGDSYDDDYIAPRHSCDAGSFTCNVCGEFVLYYGINNGEASIYYCDKAVNGAIDIPATVTEYVYDFDSVTDMVYGLDSVTDMVYGLDNVTETVYNITAIVYGAFADCTDLTSVNIPKTVKALGPKSFANCNSLKDITVPASVTEIEDMAIGYYYDGEYYRLVEGLTIHGFKGSAAEAYANENGIAFEVIKNELISSDSSSVKVVESIAQLAPEMSVSSFIKNVENENVQIVTKDGEEVTTDDLVGTGSKVQLLDDNGGVLSEYVVMVKSDIDGNGRVTPADARLALRASTGLDIIEGVYETAANYDDADTVSPSDARMILRKASGLEK